MRVAPSAPAGRGGSARTEAELLRAGLVDAALTRIPFDRTGISARVLRSDPVGVVLRADDPLAGRGTLQLWNGTIGLAPLTPLGHMWPPGLTVIAR